MLTQMPDFDDEAPTPLPQIVVSPPARAVSRAPARATSRPTNTPAPAPFQSRPVSPARPLGAAPIPEADTDPGSRAPVVRREATFIGLPVGLGAPDPSPTPRAPSPAPRAPSPVPLSLPLARPPSAPTPAAVSAPLRLANPLGSASPPAARALSPAGPVATPSRPRPPLSFDAPDPAPKPDLQFIAPAPVSGGLSPWVGLGAAAVVVTVLGLFAWSGDEPEQSQAHHPQHAARGVAGKTEAPAPIHVADAPTQPSSAVARAKASKSRGATIARRQGSTPMWSKARVAALQESASTPPEFGGTLRQPVDYHRKYLENDTSPTVPMLMIFTHPPGMTIEVSGKLYGRTPLIKAMYGEVPRLDVTLSGAGFKTKKMTLSADKEGNLRFNGVMQPIDPPTPAAATR